MGIGPTLEAWEASVLPLNYARTGKDEKNRGKIRKRLYQCVKNEAYYANIVKYMQDQVKTKKTAATAIAHHIRSFVKRERRFTPHQQRAWNELGSKYILPLQDEMLDLPQFFQCPRGSQYRYIMEIGFGGGEMLWHMVTQRPECNFIGIEVYRPGVANFLTKLLDAGLTASQLSSVQSSFNNVRLYNDDAIDVLTRSIPADSLNEVWLLFPDPWPKQRHHKRRIVQPDFVALVSEKLVDGGLFRIVTDCEDYAAWSRMILLAEPQLTENKFAAFRDGDVGELAVITKFAGRALQKGSVIWELEFKKVRKESQINVNIASHLCRT